MNKWKAFALVMIGILILVVGVSFYHFETLLFQLNEDEEAFAIDSAKNGLSTELEGYDYNITSAEHGRKISTPTGEKKVVMVIFNRGNVTFTALVDMESGDVLRKSSMEYIGWMAEYQNTKYQNRMHWLYRW
ncbi:MAG: hypothetical protein IBX39_06375 [Candidatus Methanoperedenaceae archaeon]|nr:hypothetical protein [Candidatus Methanoperedenaceae archaeon]